MEFESTDMPGVVLVHPRVHADARGTFVKTVHAPTFAGAGLEHDFVEQYHSDSMRGVVRGLHFQTPPADHAKLVFCSAGAVFDVALDLRVGSPTFGEHRSFALDAERGTMVYLPRGVAHGFCATSERATLHYGVTSVHAPASDAGVRFDSADIDWPVTGTAVTSDRDLTFPTLAEFDSPFTFDPAGLSHA